MSVKTEKCLVCESSLQPHKPYGMGFAVCSHCKIIHYLNATETRYEESYFEEEYRNQYGRSYLEDRHALKGRMQTRLKPIVQHAPPGAPVKRLLEIGSAAGFFLEEAGALGYNVTGWEISRTMSDYANQNKMHTLNGDFLSLYKKWHEKHLKGKDTPYDLVCAFYVIEHIRAQKKLWEALNCLVCPGGILALALPSSFGPMKYFQTREWGERHPKDHFVDYSPQSLARVARLYGFRLIFHQAEGIHPERFPLGRLRLCRPVLGSLQKKISFADTFFAILKRETDHKSLK